MTIIAGFKAENGIVVCSDTQETSTPSKRDVPKLHFEARGILTTTPLAVAFCGSGYGPLIDKLTSESWKAAEPYGTMDDACAAIEETIKNLYKEYWQIFQPGQCPSADLIYGVKTSEGSKLFSANGPIVNERPEYYSSGAGYYMADFLASRMYRAYLTVHQCVILAAYILSQAKEHVDGCGGESHIAVLRSDGADGLVDSTRIEEITGLLKGFDLQCGHLALHAANFSLETPKVETEIKDLREALLFFREESQERIKRHDASEFENALSRVLGHKPLPKDELGLPIYPKIYTE